MGINTMRNNYPRLTDERHEKYQRSKLGVHRILKKLKTQYAVITCLAEALIIVIQFNSLKPEVYLNIPKFSSYLTENSVSISKNNQ
jgi:hypothetical protein